MDQVSRPLQIAFLLAVAFVGVWFVALRPRPVEAPPPPAQPAQAQPPSKSSIPGQAGDALDTARGGAAQANADAAARPGRADAASGDPAADARGPFSQALGANPSTTAAQSGAALGSQMRSASLRSDNAALQSSVVAVSLVGVTLAEMQAGPARAAASGGGAGAMPARAESALAQRKTVVLLFYGRGADDRGMRTELGKVGTRGGRVVVLSAPVSTVARFGALTRGVKVLEAPTVVVVGPGRQGRAIAGFTDSTEVDQAVLSALRGR